MREAKLLTDTIAHGRLHHVEALDILQGARACMATELLDNPTRAKRTRVAMKHADRGWAAFFTRISRDACMYRADRRARVYDEHRRVCSWP